MYYDQIVKLTHEDLVRDKEKHELYKDPAPQSIIDELNEALDAYIDAYSRRTTSIGVIEFATKFQILVNYLLRLKFSYYFQLYPEIYTYPTKVRDTLESEAINTFLAISHLQEEFKKRFEEGANAAGPVPAEFKEKVVGLLDKVMGASKDSGTLKLDDILNTLNAYIKETSKAAEEVPTPSSEVTIDEDVKKAAIDWIMRFHQDVGKHDHTSAGTIVELMTKYLEDLKDQQFIQFSNYMWRIALDEILYKRKTTVNIMLRYALHISEKFKSRTTLLLKISDLLTEKERSKYGDKEVNEFLDYVLEVNSTLPKHNPRAKSLH